MTVLVIRRAEDATFVASDVLPLIATEDVSATEPDEPPALSTLRSAELILVAYSASAVGSTWLDEVDSAAPDEPGAMG
jgi:hypothetical protein